MKSRKWLVIWLALALLTNCGPKDDPTHTLVPTWTASPTQAAPSPSPPPTQTAIPTPTEVPLAARVNGEPILLADYEREVDRAGDAATPEQVLDGMIEMLLLEQAAAEANITISDAELKAIVQADVESKGPEAFKEWLAANDMTEEEYREARRRELLAQRVQTQLAAELPTTAEHVHARHILVATQAEAEAILAQLQEGADFATLAQTYSLDVSTRDRGGDLDFFPRGVLLAPELEEAAFSLTPGEISDVVHSELLGYHVIQVLEREERAISESNLEILRANQRDMMRRWTASLWEEASIERYVEP